MMTQDEWVVCRVFQKSAGVKKFPTTQSRAVNPVYNFDIGANLLPSQMMPAAAENYHFPVGRNYMGNPDQFAEFTRILRGGASTSVNLPFQSMNYPLSAGGAGSGGGFTISGLNLNLGAGGATAQPVLRPMQQPPPQQDVSSSMNMMASSASFGGEAAASYAADQIHNPNGGGNRYMGMEHCMDLDNYWPTY